ncbi:histone-lysine N-methyltransferase NSD2-like [Leptidea sinapis]|uniref:histone-lysine N-methyltransferase NSD2-like n=1 Tax=Leptidea sinapis TaxID=189913 RepID=UPI0021C342A2|nr:histone-lysine N-methyltransferase NSD2-like [Leptidea sinapis]
MEESEDTNNIMSGLDNPSVKAKSKKRSLVERQLETNLTTRVTSPITNNETTNTSRYGRLRHKKADIEFSSQSMSKVLLSPRYDKPPNKKSTYKMNASFSPRKKESKPESIFENQIQNLYSQNMSLSRFGSDEKLPKNSRKAYKRKDLIQMKDDDDSDILLISNMFSPSKSGVKPKSSHVEKSKEKQNFNSRKNGHVDLSSVVKTLDFDGDKNKNVEKRPVKNSDLFDIEASCQYQVGDLAWARMNTYPFWPCIITREPFSSLFVKKKLVGKLSKDIIHVTFFGDNGRRSWILETKLRKFHGLYEFELAREKLPADVSFIWLKFIILML